MAKNLEKNSYEGNNIDIIIPQEIPDQYHKLPVALVKWQPYLNPIHYAVLVYIVSRIHKRRCYAFPSIKTAAEECNVCENSFVTGVNKLEDLGLIVIERSAKGNKYFLRPPVEPNLELIEKHLDKKAAHKFKKKEYKKDENESTLNFKKVHYFKSEKSASSKIPGQIYSEGSTSRNDITKPHEMQTKQNSTEFEFNSNSNLNSEQREIQKKHKQNADVVDLEKIKKIRSYGVTSKKAKELIKRLNPSIDLDSFIRYILNDVGKFVDIKNTSGFLIHGLSELQEDYLEIERKKKAENNKKTNKEKSIKQFKTIKQKIENKAIKLYESMPSETKAHIWNELLVDNDYLKSNNISEELRESFYIDYIYRNYLELDDQSIDILSTDEKLITLNDLKQLESVVKDV